jgi:hypothetical protein
MDYGAIFRRKAGLEGPSGRGEYEMPPGLSAEGQQAYHAIMAVLKKYGADDGTGGCTTFYSPQEWKDRGEKYASGSELVVVYDGGPVGAFFDYDGGHEKLVSAMVAALNKVGLYSEPGTHWYSGVYKG